MRLIDADAFDSMLLNGEIEANNKRQYTIRNTINMVRGNLATVKTVDAVPVVRCKDCKYWNARFWYCEGIGNWFGELGLWDDDGYCYKGERKDDGR